MKAEIIAVGSELLLGQITNTNATFIAKNLAEVGIDVYYHTVVGDNPKRLDEAISIAQQRADLIIFSGGLGPTKDDLTKETIAKRLSSSLIMDRKALENIEAYFKRTKRTMTEKDLFKFVWVADPQISPDGTRVAFVRVTVDEKKDQYDTSIWIARTDGS